MHTFYINVDIYHAEPALNVLKNIHNEQKCLIFYRDTNVYSTGVSHLLYFLFLFVLRFF